MGFTSFNPSYGLSAACVFSSMTSFRRKMMGFAAAQPVLRLPGTPDFSQAGIGRRPVVMAIAVGSDWLGLATARGSGFSL
jgi:hypothetical protein